MDIENAIKDIEALIENGDVVLTDVCGYHVLEVGHNANIFLVDTKNVTKKYATFEDAVEAFVSSGKFNSIVVYDSLSAPVCDWLDGLKNEWKQDKEKADRAALNKYYGRGPL